MRAGLTGFLALLLTNAALAAALPIASFTNFAKYQIVKISRNGTYLAVTRRLPDYEMVTMLRWPDLTMSAQNHFGECDIDSLDWVTDARLLIQPRRRFAGEIEFKAPTGEIIGLDANGKHPDLLFGYQAENILGATRRTQRQSIDAPATLLDVTSGSPAEVLIQTFGYSHEGDINDVYRMNIRTGILEKVATSPVRDGIFYTDASHRVSVVSGRDREGDSNVYYRAPNSLEWQLRAHGDRHTGTLKPVGPFGDNGEFLALENRSAPTEGVVAWSPETGKSRLLFRNPDVDVEPESLLEDGVPWAFRYVNHFPEYWYPDPNHPLARAHKWLRDTYKGLEVHITSATDDQSLAVAQLSGPRTPAMFFVIDVKKQKVLQQLAAYPDLKSEDLAAVDPIEFKARDGLMIRGYLTTPNGSNSKKLPMIVLVHGGPHGIYDTLTFNYEAQLFASRGYAVLQVNYRGSGGRGREFMGAGYGRWGREMQDDITDGVRWAIGDGVADPKRICIYGASYGAYAALTGAFREPDLFKCAVGLSGIYDLPLMFEKGDVQTVVSGLNYLRDAVGTDKEELKRRSPVYNADKIKAAVFILHGELDKRAPFEHAKRMRTALEKAGNPPEWFTEWGEGHGFFDESNRVAAYERILAFFAKHLGT